MTIKTWFSIRRPAITSEVNKFTKGVVDYTVAVQKLLAKNPIITLPAEKDGSAMELAFRDYASNIIELAHKRAKESGEPIIVTWPFTITKNDIFEGNEVFLHYSTSEGLLSLKMKLVLDLDFIIASNANLTEGKVMGSSVVNYLRAALGAKP